MPDLIVPVPSAFRFPDAHERYKEVRELLRSRAASGMEETVVLNMRLVVAERGRVNPRVLMVCLLPSPVSCHIF